MSVGPSVPRGGSFAPGLPSELVVITVMVVGFWMLMAAVILTLLYARRRKQGLAQSRNAQHEEHVAAIRAFRQDPVKPDLAIMRDDTGRVILTPELSAMSRTAGRHRRHGGKRRIS